jgi:1-deoxy-D-xylulose 5-phosphate reductoisomerase
MTTPSQVIIDDNFRLLLNLLEKSEQILSVINLSDSAVSKYNQLKQLTFQQLNLPFNPLVKCIPHQINHTHQNPPTNNNANILLTKSFLLQNIKALMLIETIINYISNQQKEEFYLEHMDSIFNLGMNTVINKTQEELEVE